MLCNGLYVLIYLYIRVLLCYLSDEQRLNATTERNQQKLVSENVTRTKVDYLENALAKSTDKMLNLKKQKVEIDVVSKPFYFLIPSSYRIGTYLLRYLLVECILES